MKKNLIRLIFSALVSAFFTLLISCDCNISLKLLNKADGKVSLNVSFSGTCGEAFQEMLLFALANGEANSASSAFEAFDTTEISNQLKNAGFSSVLVTANGPKLEINMEDSDCKTFLFTSGLLEEASNELKINLSKAKLKAFYDSCDEELQMLLDLFLSPAFNDEAMNVAEYEEMIGYVYGLRMQEEINRSKINISITNADGKSSKKTISLSQLLCGLDF